jgi:hypothetical protein
LGFGDGIRCSEFKRKQRDHRVPAALQLLESTPEPESAAGMA